MATQTPTQRQATAQRAAATRKRDAARRSASATKTAARRTTSSAGQTARDAGRTTRHAARAAAGRLDAATSHLSAIGRQAQRALLIQLGAAATFQDRMRRTARTYTNLDLVRREFNRLEQRGAQALPRRQRSRRTA